MAAVDDVPVWVISCITVRKGYRGRSVAIAMIGATVEYAENKRAAAVERYPRQGVHDGSAHMAESMFRRAGFRRIRGVVPGLPRVYTPRVTMRATRGTARSSSPSRTRSRGQLTRPDLVECALQGTNDVERSADCSSDSNAGFKPLMAMLYDSF